MRTVGLVLGVVCLLASTRLGAQPSGGAARTNRGDRTEYWIGSIELPDPSLPRVTMCLTLTPGGSGNRGDTEGRSEDQEGWLATLDIPPAPGLPGTIGLELQDVVYTETGVSFVSPGPPSANTYRLRREPAGRGEGAGRERMTGELLLGGRHPLEAVFSRVTRAEAMDAMVRRPQRPLPPFPYTERQVSIPSGEIDRAGTLTAPDGPGPQPAVVLAGWGNWMGMGGTAGAPGPRDRDGNWGGHRPLLVLSDHLTREGFAVLRMDDRGLGAPEAYHGATGDVLAGDLRAAMAFLRVQPGIDPERVGLIGHGESAVFAAAAAGRGIDGDGRGGPAFLVLIAPQGVPGLEMLLFQDARQLAAQGEDAAYTAARGERLRAVFEAVTARDGEGMAGALKAFSMHEVGTKREDAVAISEADLEERAYEQAERLASPRFAEWLGADPRARYADVRCPVLVVAGELDLTVTTQDNLTEVVRALREHEAERGASVGMTSTLLPGLNHHLQPCATGFEDEMKIIETTIAPVALAAITHWVRERAWPARGR